MPVEAGGHIKQRRLRPPVTLKLSEYQRSAELAVHGLSPPITHAAQALWKPVAWKSAQASAQRSNFPQFQHRPTGKSYNAQKSARRTAMLMRANSQI